MLKGRARHRKPPMWQTSPGQWVPAVSGPPAVTGFTAGHVPPTVQSAPLQRWMNCICVPASSITSPLRKGTESPTSGTPLTLGRVLPSTCAKA